MKDQPIKCEVCGAKVKGSIQFVPYLKERLGWKTIEKDKESKMICPLHKKSQKYWMFYGIKTKENKEAEV